MSKRIVVLLAVVMFLVGVGLSVHAQVVVKVRHPRIHKAVNDLQVIRLRLAQMPPKFGGHRTLGIRNIDVAILELQQAELVPTHR
jgi:hypothetical protein